MSGPTAMIGSLDDIFQPPGRDHFKRCRLGAIEPSLRQAEIERAKRQAPGKSGRLRSSIYERCRTLTSPCQATPRRRSRCSTNRSPCSPTIRRARRRCVVLRAALPAGGLHEDDRTRRAQHMRAPHSKQAPTIHDTGHRGLRHRPHRARLHSPKTAMNAIDRALALNGSSALALALGSTILAHAGRTSQAIAYAERALRLSLHDPTIYSPRPPPSASPISPQAISKRPPRCATRLTQSNPRFSFPRVLQTGSLVVPRSR